MYDYIWLYSLPLYFPGYMFPAYIQHEVSRSGYSASNTPVQGRKQLNNKTHMRGHYHNIGRIACTVDTCLVKFLLMGDPLMRRNLSNKDTFSVSFSLDKYIPGIRDISHYKGHFLLSSGINVIERFHCIYSYLYTIKQLRRHLKAFPDCSLSR